jgi:hypothetical protein
MRVLPGMQSTFGAPMVVSVFFEYYFMNSPDSESASSALDEKRSVQVC